MGVIFSAHHFNHRFRPVCITIAASVPTCMIRSNFHTLQTPAGAALSSVLFSIDPAAEHRFDQPSINTGAVADPQRGQIYLLTACHDLHPALFCSPGKPFPELIHFFPAWRTELDPRHILFRLRIHIQKADDHPAGVSAKLSCDLAERLLMAFHRIPAGKENRIISPYHPAASDPVRKFLKSRDQHRFLVRQPRFNLAAIPGESELKIIRPSVENVLPAIRNNNWVYPYACWHLGSFYFPSSSIRVFIVSENSFSSLSITTGVPSFFNIQCVVVP